MHPTTHIPKTTKAHSSLFIASTGQNVGKTTLSLGLFHGLKKRFSSVAFFKPIGQQHVTLESGEIVDKDAALFSSYFSLHDLPHDVSPIICDSGFTRRFLDRSIHQKDLENSVLSTFQKLQHDHPFVLVEGTGHMGVGSIFSLNNASVAALIKTPVIIISTGGLGSSFDELCLNISLAKEYGANIQGVILNKVLPEKRSMVETYFPKALNRLGIPLIGIVPFLPALSRPTMRDFSLLFKRALLAGIQQEMHHIQEITLIAGSLESFLQEYRDQQTIITPSCRDDIILSCIERKMREQFLYGKAFHTALILTGMQEPKMEIVQKLDIADIPTIWVPECAFQVMKEVSTFTAKIQKEDESKIQKACELVEKHINFDLLLRTSS